MQKHYTIPSSLDGLLVIQDPSKVINCVKNHNHCCRFEFGNSLYPILKSGQFCELIPISDGIIDTGDIVFCKVNGVYMTHMVEIVNNATGYCKIVDTQGNCYGWAKKEDVYALAGPMEHVMSERPFYVFRESDTNS